MFDCFVFWIFEYVWFLCRNHFRAVWRQSLLFDMWITTQTNLTFLVINKPRIVFLLICINQSNIFNCLTKLLKYDIVCSNCNNNPVLTFRTSNQRFPICWLADQNLRHEHNHWNPCRLVLDIRPLPFKWNSAPICVQVLLLPRMLLCICLRRISAAAFWMELVASLCVQAGCFSCRWCLSYHMELIPFHCSQACITSINKSKSLTTWIKSATIVNSCDNINIWSKHRKCLISSIKQIKQIRQMITYQTKHVTNIFLLQPPTTST